MDRRRGDGDGDDDDDDDDDDVVVVGVSSDGASSCATECIEEEPSRSSTLVIRVSKSEAVLGYIISSTGMDVYDRIR